MAAVAMPDVDRRTLERIRDRLAPPTAMDLSEIEVPELEQTAAEASLLTSDAVEETPS